MRYKEYPFKLEGGLAELQEMLSRVADSVGEIRHPAELQDKHGIDMRRIKRAATRPNTTVGSMVEMFEMLGARVSVAVEFDYKVVFETRQRVGEGYIVGQVVQPMPWKAVYDVVLNGDVAARDFTSPEAARGWLDTRMRQESKAAIGKRLKEAPVGC